MSGATSASIFGGQSAGGGSDYNFDHNLGAAGIGTSNADSSAAQAGKATQSFLIRRSKMSKLSINLNPFVKLKSR